MNTKHTRVVVTLFLAVATLATMGFSAPYGDSSTASIWPDLTTCELAPVPYTALDLLNRLDEPCFANSIDEIESEISKGAAAPSARALIQGILGRSVGGPSEDLFRESVTEAGLSPTVERSTYPFPVDLYALSATDVAEIELDRAAGNASSARALVESILGRSISGPSEDLFRESVTIDNANRPQDEPRVAVPLAELWPEDGTIEHLDWR